MTENMREKVIAMYKYYDFKCFVTGLEATQRAHIIGNTRANRKRFGDDIIDNPLNWLPAHDLESNALIDVGHASNLPIIIAQAISDGDRTKIERLVRENINRKLSKRGNNGR